MTKELSHEEVKAIRYLFALIDASVGQMEQITEYVKIFGMVELFDKIETLELSAETKEKLRAVKSVVEATFVKAPEFKPYLAVPATKPSIDVADKEDAQNA